MGKLGCAGILIVVLVIAVFGGNEMFGFYLENCQGEDDVFDCVLAAASEEEEEPEGAVTATGTYTYKDFDVTVTANIPLEGGAVTGTVSGTCAGKVKGTFSGQDGGAISGTLSGACSPFIVNIPAGADFSGVVNKGSKTVPIGFTGRGAGITHQGSMSLTY
jgi:hypothetical protein